MATPRATASDLRPLEEGRGEGEVDLVLIDDKRFKPKWAVEIKWSNRYYQMPQDLISLISFCKANELTAALITTKDTIGTKTLDELQFTFYTFCPLRV